MSVVIVVAVIMALVGVVVIVVVLMFMKSSRREDEQLLFLSVDLGFGLIEHNRFFLHRDPDVRTKVLGDGRSNDG